MHYVGDLREKFGIPGPRNPELAHIRNKTLMKVKAEEANIPTAKFLTVDFLTETNTEVLAERITSKITAFPIFAKPEHGVACGGSAKIANREELVHWITENLNKNAVKLHLSFFKRFLESAKNGFLNLISDLPGRRIHKGTGVLGQHCSTAEWSGKDEFRHSFRSRLRAAQGFDRRHRQTNDFLH